MSMAIWLYEATLGLSPLQRAVLVLQANREGREPAPERDIEDEQQTSMRALGILD